MRSRLYNSLILLALLFAFYHSAQAQNGGEMEHIDCLYSKEIIVPFNYSPDPKATAVKPLLDQTVFYSYRDQFSYWYKVRAKDAGSVNFHVKAINDSDSYALYVYQYNGDDFCKQVYSQKAKPVKPTFFSQGRISDPFDLSDKTFPVQKDNTYYICVLNTSVNNCGHTLQLSWGKDTLRVKALHMPCKRELKALAVTTPVKKTNPPKDTTKAPVVTMTPPTNTVVTKEPEAVSTPRVEVSTNEVSLACHIKDTKKHLPLAAHYTLIDQVTNEAVNTVATGKGQFSTTLEKGKSYKLKCTAFGYKNTDQSFIATTNGHAIQIIDVEMEPLKEGDNFVMRSIYFYPNTYALKRESAGELNKLLDFLKNNESVSLEIQGHTNGDNRIVLNKSYESMGEEWNFQGSAKKLSQKRAEVIKTFLTTNGIAPERLTAKGYGGDSPIVKYPETNEEGQRNIRVEIVILKE